MANINNNPAIPAATYTVKGQTFASNNPAAQNPAPRTLVSFQAEPNNAYDPQAIMVIDDQGRRNGYLAREHAAAWRQQGYDDARIQQLVGIVVRTGNPGNNFNIRVKVVGRFTPALLAQYNAAPAAAAAAAAPPAPVAPAAPPAPVFGPVLDKEAQRKFGLARVRNLQALLRDHEDCVKGMQTAMARIIIAALPAENKRQRTE